MTSVARSISEARAKPERGAKRQVSLECSCSRTQRIPSSSLRSPWLRTSSFIFLRIILASVSLVDSSEARIFFFSCEGEFEEKCRRCANVVDQFFFFDECGVIQSPREFGESFDDSDDDPSTKRSTAARRKRRKKTPRRSIHRREADKTKRHEPRKVGANAKTAG